MQLFYRTNTEFVEYGPIEIDVIYWYCFYTELEAFSFLHSSTIPSSKIYILKTVVRLQRTSTWLVRYSWNKKNNRNFNSFYMIRAIIMFRPTMLQNSQRASIGNAIVQIIMNFSTRENAKRKQVETQLQTTAYFFIFFSIVFHTCSNDPHPCQKMEWSHTEHASYCVIHIHISNNDQIECDKRCAIPIIWNSFKLSGTDKYGTATLSLLTNIQIIPSIFAIRSAT